MDMGAQGKYKMAMSFDDVLNGMEISAIEQFCSGQRDREHYQGQRRYDR